ncbi:MAG: NAD(+)/NADH kinase [Aristaeellaceae bacterium]
MRILLIPNTTRADALSFADTMLARLHALGHEAYLYQQADDPRLPSTDLAIVAGGDGTVLRAVRSLFQYPFPYWAVNFGHLGYLTECEPEEADAALSRILAGDYRVEHRALLSGSMTCGDAQEGFTGLNEAVIHRGASIRPLHLSVAVDGTPVMHFAGDGVLVSTPTGSTAYNLSAGGPILMPESNQLVLAPICAHAALCAPLVVSGQHTIRIDVEDGGPETAGDTYCLDIDGCHRMMLLPGGHVTCALAPWTVGLVRTTDAGFYRRLQQKMAGRD